MTQIRLNMMRNDFAQKLPPSKSMSEPKVFSRVSSRVEPRVSLQTKLTGRATSELTKRNESSTKYKRFLYDNRRVEEHCTVRDCNE